MTARPGVGVHASRLALTARMSIGTSTWVIITALSVLTVSTRALQREMAGWDAVLYVACSVAVVPVVMMLANAVMRSRVSSTGGAVSCALVAWVGAGAIRIALETAFAERVSGSVVVLPWFVYLSQLVTLPLWAGILGLVQAANLQRAQVLIERDDLIARLTRSTEERWRDLDEERAALAAHVADTIRPQIDRIRQLLERADAGPVLMALGGELQQVSEQSREIVRSASHETAMLAQRSDRLRLNQPPAPVRDSLGWRIADLSTRRWAAAPGPVALALLVSATPLLLGAGGLRAWLLLPIVIPTALALDAALLWALRPLLRRLTRGAAWPLIVIANTASIAGGLVIVRIATAALSIDIYTARSAPYAAVFVVLLGLFATLAQIWSADRREIQLRAARTARVEEEVAALEVDMEAEYARVCARTARLLHGPVQGRLAAISMALRLAVDRHGFIDGGTIRTCRALADACSTDLDLLVRVDRSPAVLEDMLRDLGTRWQGLLTLHWTLDPHVRALIDADAALRTRVGDFIGDCATNACRHGAARHLSITGHFTADGAMEFSAEDDGRGPELPIRPGSGLGSLGTQGRDWWIERSATGGCVVRYRVSVSEFSDGLSVLSPA